MLPPSWETSGTMLQTRVVVNVVGVGAPDRSQLCEPEICVADMCKIGLADYRLMPQELPQKGKVAANAAALKMPEVNPRRTICQLIYSHSRSIYYV